MNFWYLIAAPAWLVIIVTAAARLADLGRDKWELRHHVRRVGLSATGLAAALMLYTPISQDWWQYCPATWRTTLLGWGWALVWFTTEGMPPWSQFILGHHRRAEDWPNIGRRARLVRELHALRESFMPTSYGRRSTDIQGPRE